MTVHHLKGISSQPRLTLTLELNVITLTFFLLQESFKKFRSKMRHSQCKQRGFFINIKVVVTRLKRSMYELG